MRDTTTIMEASFAGKDTIIPDRTVQPNTAYSYTVRYLKNGKTKDSSDLDLTTLDVSNSDFTWEVLYFGERDNNFRAASIADDDDIWVVGLIELWGWDSLDLEYDWLRYNSLHWDGHEWNIECIAPPPWNTYTGALDAVYAISDTVVWMGVDAPVKYLSGTWYACTTFPDLSWMRDIWGSSVDNTFFIHYYGGIAHYNGKMFTTMNSGTSVNLDDIDGNDERVFCVGETVVLEYKSNQWKTLLTSKTVDGNLENGDMGTFYSVKVLDGVTVITCATMATLKYYYDEGIYDSVPQKITPLDDCWAVEIVDGNAVNDLAYITEGGEVVYYNGKDYAKIFDYEDVYEHDIIIRSGDFKDNTICAVGKAQGYGVVIIGRR